MFPENLVQASFQQVGVIMIDIVRLLTNNNVDEKIMKMKQQHKIIMLRDGLEGAGLHMYIALLWQIETQEYFYL